MGVYAGVEEEGSGLEADDQGIGAGEAEAYEEVDTQCSEDGLRRWPCAREDATEDDGDHRDVKDEAEHPVKDNEMPTVSGADHEAFKQRWHSKAENKDEEVASKGNGVHRQQRDGASQSAKGVVAEGVPFRVGVQHDEQEQEEEEQGEPLPEQKVNAVRTVRRGSVCQWSGIRGRRAHAIEGR